MEKVPSGPVRKSRKQFFFNFFFREILTSEYFWVPVSFSYGYHPLLFVHGQNFLPSGSEKESASFCLHRVFFSYGVKN